MRTLVLVPVIALGLLSHACDDSPSPAESPAENRAATPAQGAAASGPIDIDACKLVDAAEIAAATETANLKAREEPQPAGASGCRYLGPLGTVASVNTHFSDATQFDEFKGLIGPEAETAAGVGDAAYFWNPNRIYVRVGGRGFSLTIHHSLPPDKMREALLSLARAGVEAMRRLPPR